MFKRISSVTLSILMFVLILGTQVHFYFFLASLAFLILASLAVNFKRLNFTWPHLLLPIIYIIGVGSLYGIIGSFTIRLIFLIIASLTFYFLEMWLGRESHFLQNIFLLSVFAWYCGIFGVQFYLRLPGILFVIIIFLMTYLFALQGFAGFNQPSKKYFNILLSLLCAEGAAGLLLWPTHFFIDAVVLFCLFYIIWLFSFSAFFGKLSRPKVYWQIGLIIIVLAVVLSTTAWKPLS